MLNTIMAGMHDAMKRTATIKLIEHDRAGITGDRVDMLSRCQVKARDFLQGRLHDAIRTVTIRVSMRRLTFQLGLG